MLRDGSVEAIEGGEAWAGGGKRHDWREVDQALRALAVKRGKLDAEEARWLREAERLEIWQEVGCVSLLEYIERVLGYGPRAAQERLRVAFALEEMPELETALEQGMPFSAIRELSRVATRDTVQAWLDDARGKTAHEVQQRVAGRMRGDRPCDSPRPDLKPRVLRFEVKPATYALVRQAQAKLAKERGTQLDEDELMSAFAGCVLEGGEAAPSGRAKYQVAIAICPACKQGRQEGAGVSVAIDEAAVERALCDAQHIGSLDTNRPTKPTQDIPAATRRYVWRRDRGCCCVPGCRSRRNIEVHHIVAREDGGSHAADNLMLLCDGHHTDHHAGLLSIRGKAPDQLTIERNGNARVFPDPRPRARRCASSSLEQDATAALRTSGFRPNEAAAAVRAAAVAVGTDVPIEVFLREALKHSR